MCLLRSYWIAREFCKIIESTGKRTKRERNQKKELEYNEIGKKKKFCVFFFFLLLHRRRDLHYKKGIIILESRTHLQIRYMILKNEKKKKNEWCGRKRQRIRILKTEQKECFVNKWKYKYSISRALTLPPFVQFFKLLRPHRPTKRNERRKNPIFLFFVFLVFFFWSRKFMKNSDMLRIWNVWPLFGDWYECK